MGSGVHCPDGKALDISEQCEDKCYNDWRTSEVLDPLNSNFKCEKSLGRDKKSLCLPTAEMCQGLEICGEVDICNKNDLRCPRNQNNKISSARIFTPSGLPEVTIRNLPSQLTSDHYYCHYASYFENDLEYNYIDRQDEAVHGRREDIKIDYSDLQPCQTTEWSSLPVTDSGTTCDCPIPGVLCPGSDLYTDFSDGCIPMILWCREDQQFSCKVGNDSSIRTADKNLCKNYTFWRQMHEGLSFNLLNNTLRIKPVSCRGSMQTVDLPWYFNSLGTFGGMLITFKGTCTDQSDKIFSLHSVCDSKVFLQIYSDAWCGEGVDSGVRSRCPSLEQWFSLQTDRIYTDPQDCQDSCLHPGPQCEACTNPDYFVCEESQVCIHPMLVCDGHPQCQFGEDEGLELCTEQDRWVRRGVVAPYASFTCRSQMYPGMTTVATACNGVMECYDGSDEGSCSDTLSIYFLIISILGVIILYAALKFVHIKNSTGMSSNIVSETNQDLTLENLYEVEGYQHHFKENHEDEETIKILNARLLQMIFSEKRDTIKGKCILFYDLLARVKNNNEPEIFCYLHNHYDSNVVKEISKAKFPGLTEKITDKVEKLFHYRFITRIQDEITKNVHLAEHLSTFNTMRKVISNSLDFFKDSYLAIYLLIIVGGPRAILNFMTNFTSVIILSLLGTIVIPIIMSSIYIGLKNPSLVLDFMEEKTWKLKKRTHAIICILSGPLIPIFLLHSLQTTFQRAKRCAKRNQENILYMFEKSRHIKDLLASILRIELGE